MKNSSLCVALLELFFRLFSAGDRVNRRGLFLRPGQLSWERLRRERSSKVTVVYFWTLKAYRTTSPAKVRNTQALCVQLQMTGTF